MVVYYKLIILSDVSELFDIKLLLQPYKYSVRKIHKSNHLKSDKLNQLLQMIKCYGSYNRRSAVKLSVHLYHFILFIYIHNVEILFFYLITVRTVC